MKKKNTTYVVLCMLAAILALGMANCAPPTDDGLQGQAAITVSKNAIKALDIQRVEIVITGENISAAIVDTLTETDGRWKGTIANIPVGADRTFEAVAYDSSNQVSFRGKAQGVSIQGGQTTSVLIMLQQVNPPEPFDNTVPFIDALVANPSTLAPGGTAALKVSARDIDPGDSVSYTWVSQAGTFSSTSQAEVTWTAPTLPGSYKITLTVSDTKGASLAVSVTMVVEEPSEGSASVTASFNTIPSVQLVAAAPGRVEANGVIALQVVAFDLDGDEVDLVWNDQGGECAGTFSNKNTKDPIWGAPAKIPASGTCKLSVTVSDGNGGKNTGSITIQVGPKLAFKSGQDTTAPELMTSIPDGTPVSSSTQVTLTCRDDMSGCRRIIYTTDGSEPSFNPPNGTIVEGDTASADVFSIIPLANVTLKFRAEDNAGNISDTQEATYFSVP